MLNRECFRLLVCPYCFQDVSYAPFSKGARLGMLANFLEPLRPTGRGTFSTDVLEARCCLLGT